MAVAEPAPASDEVVVAIEAFSINRGETFVLERSRPGWRPDKEIAGPVVCADADGGGPVPGHRVVRHLVRAGVGELAAVPHELARRPARRQTVAAGRSRG